MGILTFDFNRSPLLDPTLLAPLLAMLLWTRLFQEAVLEAVQYPRNQQPRAPAAALAADQPSVQPAGAVPLPRRHPRRPRRSLPQSQEAAAGLLSAARVAATAALVLQPDLQPRKQLQEAVVALLQEMLPRQGRLRRLPPWLPRLSLDAHAQDASTKKIGCESKKGSGNTRHCWLSWGLTQAPETTSQDVLPMYVVRRSWKISHTLGQP